MTKYHAFPCSVFIANALREGRKTQERRIITPQPEMVQDCEPEGYCWVPMYKGRELSHVQAPWQPGDVLWVREAWSHDAPSTDACRVRHEDAMSGLPTYGPYSRADKTHENSGLTWRPSIHMPKWAARTFLLVESVRVQRVQDISVDDACAEIGSEETDCPARQDNTHSDDWYDGEACVACGAPGAVETFRALWNSLYSARGLGWDANPWVYVYNLKLTAKPNGWPEGK